MQQEEPSSSVQREDATSAQSGEPATTPAVGHEGQNGSTSKGKAKAVTVEEADDDER